MANRYWRGGTASWDGTAGTKWADTVGGAGGATVPTTADDVFFDAGSGAITCTIAAGNTGAKSINCTGFTGTIAGIASITVSGSVTLVAGMTYTYTGTLAINAASTLTSGGKTHGSIAFNASGATLTLGDACTISNQRQFSLTAGTVDLNGNTLSTGSFNSSGTGTRAITFGSANIALTSTTAATTVLGMATATGFSWTGTGGFTRNQAATATVNFGATAGGTASNAPNLTVNAGASALTITTSSIFKNVDFTGSTCSVSALYSACGNLTLASGGTYTSLSPIFIASGTLTSTGKTLGSTSVNGSGITLTLGDALTLSTGSTFTLTQGTLDLNGNTLSTGTFSSNNANTRAITFGSANIALTNTTAGTTVLAMATATNFSMTTSGGGFTRNMAATATIQFGSSGGATASSAPNLTVNAGASALTITSGSNFKNVDFTGSTCTVTANLLYVCGNLTLASGGTYTSVVPTFIASGTLTSTGKTLGNTTVNGSGITVTLGDALTIALGSFLSLSQGTFNAANFNVTVGRFLSTSSQTRTLNMGSGTWTMSDSGSFAWYISITTNLTLNPSTSTITLTSASAKTFTGGGLTYYNLNQGGAGTLTITGANTFNNITNTNATASQITFPASTTTTVSSFTLSGSAGNLVSLRSSTPATQFTLSDASGTVSVSYLDIQDSNATGGAVWEAYLTNGNVNSGNNTGWYFTPPAGNFLLFLTS